MRGLRAALSKCSEHGRDVDMTAPGMLMILTENHTMLDPRDMRGLVELARIAEDSGFDSVMVSEQTMLGPDADVNGVMSNPRMYAAIGNQDPMTPWPSSVATLAAVAAATSRVRVVAGAIIPPLRHPILLAKDLATIDLLCEGRLVVQPTVSWQRAEYEAHGVAFSQRGRILDEHLEAMVSSVGPARLRASRVATSALTACTASPSLGVRRARECGSAASGCIPRWSGAWLAMAAASIHSAHPPPRIWPNWLAVWLPQAVTSPRSS